MYNDLQMYYSMLCMYDMAFVESVTKNVLLFCEYMEHALQSLI